MVKLRDIFSVDMQMCFIIFKSQKIIMVKIFDICGNYHYVAGTDCNYFAVCKKILLCLNARYC